MKIIGVLFIILTFAINCAWADGFTWEDKSKKIDAPPHATAVDFIFKFQNQTKLKARLISAQASCGCTIPKTEKSEYAPDEEGVLSGVYTPGSRRGLNTVSIIIKGEYIKEKEIVPFEQNLTLSVFIPEIVGVTPGITFWRLNSEPLEKRIRLEVKQEQPLKIKIQEITNPNFTATIEPIFEGRAYDIVVRPQSTSESTQALIVLESVDAFPKPLRFSCHLVIK
ncbi:MAG: DUF1573 domain-containing protein [Opitutus sp.]|nr:DUF1573 domain-containing protein [Opitutus sp.]MCS6274848.1 DUF1573 domain-containing protein [Opitutus sp.]MCS6278395.1 DUF1573 domain-containing protein [Opitutus sp.]MCS6299505.1 DUF1573 domain-containing protein [Opitutus sp.]